MEHISGLLNLINYIRAFC